MINLELRRIFYAPTYTIGKLYVNGVYWTDTLEDRCRDENKNGKLDNKEAKIMHKTAILQGTYEVIVNMSPRFKRMLPRLLNVPNFDGILIHNGTDENSTSGCIIVGENKVKGKVINSTFWMNKLTDYLLDEQKKGVKIKIKVS